MIKKRAIAIITSICIAIFLIPTVSFAGVTDPTGGTMIMNKLETIDKYNDFEAAIQIDISSGQDYHFNYESDANGKAFIDGLQIQSDCSGTMYFKIANQAFEQTASENEAIFKVVGYGSEKRFDVVCVSNNTGIKTQTIPNFDVQSELLSSKKEITNIEYSEDAIVIGDPDSIEDAYVAQGTVTVSYNLVNTYNRTTTKVELKYGTTLRDYTVSSLPSANGTVTADKTSAKQGDTVTLTVSPDDGYRLKQIQVLDGLGQDLCVEISLAITNNTFSMPDMNVRIQGIFEKIDADGATDELAEQDGKVHFGTPVPDDCVLDIREIPLPSFYQVKDGEAAILFDITVLRNNTPYPITDNNMTITITLPASLLEFDHYRVSYLNSENKLVETQAAVISGNQLQFTTNHLSNYMVEASNAPSHTHSFGSEWKSDDTNHWHECSCGEKSDTAAHTYGEWTITKNATATEKGSKERVCSACGYKETTDIAATGVSPRTGDDSNMFLWFTLMLVSGGVLAVLGITNIRRKNTAK